MPPPSTTVVRFLLISIVLAVPKSVSFTSVMLSPADFLKYFAPVATARSDIMFLLSSPYLGALTAATFIEPLTVFMISAARACPSTSSATISSGLDSRAAISRAGRIWSTLSILESVTNRSTFSCLTTFLRVSVTKAPAA